ncbi:MarR family transcriptional regulator [Streptomyces sp. J2-1]|uniref:MarR family winged helix-turn-helix transcriptional regulator n=1 Tax=Streptomyces corallincola TaxID=2851888 RepID=UPI001C395BD0|nr:MarR family transcriptional regulator [Streptomyces corallincola]MBV2358063.1 MarR family transcriptional regulator [Streptomyces corallincola]
MSDTSPHPPSPSAVHASQLVRSVVGRLRRRIRTASESDDITLGQTAVLGLLSDGDAGGMTVSDLAAAEGMRHQSMTSTVAPLVTDGLVERRRDPDDGRRLLLVLTEAGRRRVEEGRQARREWLAARLEEKCTEEERRTVIAAMTVLERLIHD